MSEPQDDAGVISISSDSDSDNGAVAPVAGPSNIHRRRAPLAAQGSAELDVPHALDDASRAQIHVAIATAPEERVREAFAAFVDSVPAITERVFSMLVAVPPLAYYPQQPVAMPVPPAAAPWNVFPPPVQAPPVARAVPLVPRWQTCANCEEEYDAGTIRQAGECNYHTGQLSMQVIRPVNKTMLIAKHSYPAGRLEVNYNAWPDWDEDVHGEMDTAENRRLYPENFTWSCCGCDGTEQGCVEDEHEPREVQRGQKRARRH